MNVCVLVDSLRFDFSSTTLKLSIIVAVNRHVRWYVIHTSLMTNGYRSYAATSFSVFHPAVFSFGHLSGFLFNKRSLVSLLEYFVGVVLERRNKVGARP